MNYDSDREALLRGCGCLILVAAFVAAAAFLLRIFGRWYLGV